MRIARGGRRRARTTSRSRSSAPVLGSRSDAFCAGCSTGPDAQSELVEALARFEQLGAPLWAQRAREELARIGGRAPSTDDLTPTEQRIADLVAGGMTNREVAATLFVTPKTVESALTRVYRKLGVRSRTELALRLGDHG